MSELILAAEKGDCNALKIFLEENVDLYVKRRLDGKSILHRVASLGHFNFLSLLLENGFDVNCVDNDG